MPSYPLSQTRYSSHTTDESQIQLNSFCNIIIYAPNQELNQFLSIAQSTLIHYDSICLLNAFTSLFGHYNTYFHLCYFTVLMTH